MHQGVNFLDLMYQTAQAMRKNVPNTIASMTGGEYELFTTRKNFEGRMNNFTNHLHSRYLLSFYPKEPHSGLHQISVRLKDPKDYTVLSRTSYFAEAAKSEIPRTKVLSASPIVFNFLEVHSTLHLQASCQLFPAFHLPTPQIFPSIQIKADLPSW